MLEDLDHFCHMLSGIYDDLDEEADRTASAVHEAKLDLADSEETAEWSERENKSLATMLNTRDRFGSLLVTTKAFHTQLQSDLAKLARTPYVGELDPEPDADISQDDITMIDESASSPIKKQSKGTSSKCNQYTLCTIKKESTTPSLPAVLHSMHKVKGRAVDNTAKHSGSKANPICLLSDDEDEAFTSAPRSSSSAHSASTSVQPFIVNAIYNQQSRATPAQDSHVSRGGYSDEEAEIISAKIKGRTIQVPEGYNTVQAKQLLDTARFGSVAAPSIKEEAGPDDTVTSVSVDVGRSNAEAHPGHERSSNKRKRTPVATDGRANHGRIAVKEEATETDLTAKRVFRASIKQEAVSTDTHKQTIAMPQVQQADSSAMQLKEEFLLPAMESGDQIKVEAGDEQGFHAARTKTLGMERETDMLLVAKKEEME